MLKIEPRHDLLSALRARLALHALNLLVALVHGRFCFKGVEVRVPKGCFAPVFVSTGLLFETALRVVSGRRVGCEVGTGVGSLALALIKELGVEIVGSDVDLKCLREAAANAVRNGLYPLFHPVACLNAQALRDCGVDFAVVNPPYLPLPPAGIAGIAACGGARLEVLNAMLQDSVRVLRRRGVLLFSSSSLTSVSGARLLNKRWAVFDTVHIYFYAKT